MWKVRCLKELFRIIWNMREKFHLNGKSHRERNCLHEALKSLEIWDEHISVILRFLDAHKLSRTWSASAQKLYSDAYLSVDQISLFNWRKQTGLNRIFEKRQSCLSSGGHAVSSQFFNFEKNALYLPRHYKQEQQMATTEVQCNLKAYFFLRNRKISIVLTKTKVEIWTSMNYGMLSLI